MSREESLPAVALLRRARSSRIAWPAFKIAVVVGIVLNAINNGDHLLRSEAINAWQVALNFLVPYCVSSYSAARNDLRRALGE